VKTAEKIAVELGEECARDAIAAVGGGDPQSIPREPIGGDWDAFDALAIDHEEHRQAFEETYRRTVDAFLRLSGAMRDAHSGEDTVHVVLVQIGQNGWPRKGDYVQYDGQLYRLVSVTGVILTGASKRLGNHMFGQVEDADWEDLDEGEDAFPIHCTLADREG